MLLEKDVLSRRKRAIIYCRVSTDKQEQDGESLDYQEKKGCQYAELHNMDVIIVLHEAKSGFIHYSLREKLTLARQMIRDHLADVIIVFDLRRFSRNFVHSAMIFEEIESNGGEIVSVSENIDNSLTGKLIRSILAWSAESEREKIVEYANRHWQKRHSLGLPMATTTPPYGWQWGDKEKTYFVLNIEEAAVRRSIFEMFVELDMSIRQVAHKLTLDGVPAPRQARKLQNDGKVIEAEINEEGKPKFVRWTTGTIHMYLQDVANIGTLVICKQKKVLLENGRTKCIQHPDQKVIPGGMPPIVSPEMFERAARRLALNRETKSQRPRDPENYLLIGHVYCAICGNRMRPTCDKKTHVYRCTKHMSILDANPRCEPHIQRITTSFIDQYVWKECCQLFERLDAVQAKLEKEVQHWLDNLFEDTTGSEQINALKAAIEQAQKRYDQQPDEYLRGLIAQDIAVKREQLRRFEEEFVTATDIAAIQANYQQRVLDFVRFINVMRGRYPEATFQEKRNALDVLGVKAHVSPSTEPPPVIQVECEQQLLTIAEVVLLTGIPRTTLQQAIIRGALHTQQRIEQQTMVYRDDAIAYQQQRRCAADLTAFEDEWFSLHKLSSLGIASYPIIHRDIDSGVLPTEARETARTVIDRDELNRFLRETPIQSRSSIQAVTHDVKVTYNPIIAGVQASL